MKLVSRFSDPSCHGEIYSDDDWTYVIRGACREARCHGLRYWAAAPPDLRTSLAGSGLPFANQHMALDQSQNRGVAECHDGRFELRILRPNSYYINQGTTLVPPQLNLQMELPGRHKPARVTTVRIGDPISYRSLKSLPGQPNRSTGR